MPPFKLYAPYSPAGDQPEAICQLVEGIRRGERFQVLMGVTGSGKTFTIANVIEQVQMPTLVISHNKTLTAQLYGEFRAFFPENAVEYFVSYYDYYQPEAYLPHIDLYIEKDASINEEIDKLRLKTLASLQSGRRDVIVVATVSCIYGMGNPRLYKSRIIRLSVGETLNREELVRRLVSAMYSRVTYELRRGTFRITGDTIDIYPPYADYIIRISFWGDEVEALDTYSLDFSARLEGYDHIAIYPADMYLMPEDMLDNILAEIEADMHQQVEYFLSMGKTTEARRLEERVRFDLQMMRELGYCKGIENYSRYFDRRLPGERPFTIIDYFPEEWLLIIDESHVTVPQLKSMYEGDRARKQTLVEYGFRLPAALDNRPLRFEEFESLINQCIFVSATPANYELELTGGAFVEQVVRPTGLPDPEVEIHPTAHQIDHLIGELNRIKRRGERALVTTLTKHFAEELAAFLKKHGIQTRYIHDEVETLERVEILRDLKLGKLDVVVGVNLLREGLDLPEVSLVAILDADKEGFLRSARSLIQIAGRAARNINGKVILYADRMTPAIEEFLQETRRRRQKQLEYNRKHNIQPKSVPTSPERIRQQTAVLEIRENKASLSSTDLIEQTEKIPLASDPILNAINERTFARLLIKLQKAMYEAAKREEYLEAARLRDELYQAEKLYEQRFNKPAPTRVQREKHLSSH